MLLAEWLARSADRHPDREAVVVEDRRLTYGELDAQVSRLANALRAGGVAPGDRVAIHLETCVEGIVAIFAALRAGAAFLSIYHSTKEEKLARLLAHAAPTALIVPGPKKASLAAVIAGAPSLKLVLWTGEPEQGGSHGSAGRGGEAPLISRILADGDPRRTATPVGDDDLAALIYTSGSTGEPKGVMLSHANVATAIDAVIQYLHLTADDVLFNVLPLSFGYGLTQLFSAISVGAKFVAVKGILFPHVTLTKAAEEKITGMAMVPTIAAVILNMDLSQYALGSLRYVTNAGAALPTELGARFRAKLPGVALIPMYGQTECLRISYLEPDQVDARPASCGRGMPNQQHWLLDDANREVAAGEVGELVVAGGHVMRGYWQNAEETAKRLRPAALPGLADGARAMWTGDLFRKDDEGYLYFVSRKDEIIKSKGEKVSPREVEDALYALDGVLEAAVIGVADPISGQVIKAFVVAKPGVTLTARQVQRHCALRLEDYMIPAQVELRESLPRTTTGKIDKKELR